VLCSPALFLCCRPSTLLTAAPAPPRRHLLLRSPPHVAPSPSTALAPPPWPSRARATPPRGSAVRHLAAAAAARACPLAPLFWFKSSTSFFSSHSTSSFALQSPRAPNTTAASFFLADEPMVAAELPHREPHCPGRPPRKLHRAMLKLYDPTPTPILRRSPIAVVLLFSGEILSPSSPYLRPSSVQSDHPNSFSSSCCSY
jgi:hypothetical protein